MNERNAWQRSWLVAAWPGMGAVAQIAATHLALQLRARPIEESDSVAHHDPASIHVKAGVVQPWQAPRNLLHGWRHLGGGHDLLVLLSERQPPQQLRAHAQALVERARQLGVERVVTFAAMGTPMHPTADPRVFAVATAPELLDEARSAGAIRLEDGEVSGMNGILLGAAAEQGMPALGLLGEMPFFAAGLPNPRSAAAVLAVFSRIAGLDVDLTRLHDEARRLEPVLVGQAPAEWPAPLAKVERTEGEIPAELRQHIEALFAVAGEDRQKALELKALLDRHGLFGDYEDRFLDLFQQGS